MGIGLSDHCTQLTCEMTCWKPHQLAKQKLKKNFEIKKALVSLVVFLELYLCVLCNIFVLLTFLSPFTVASLCTVIPLELQYFYLLFDIETLIFWHALLVAAKNNFGEKKLRMNSSK